MSANLSPADAARRNRRSLVIALAVPMLVAAAEVVGITMFIAASPRPNREEAPPHIADEGPPALAEIEIPVLVKPVPPPQPIAERPLEPPPKIVIKPSPPPDAPKAKPEPKAFEIEGFWSSPRWPEAKLTAKASQCPEVGLEAMEPGRLKQFADDALRSNLDSDNAAVKLLIEQRADLAGLPFVLDDRSRLSADAAQHLAAQGQDIHECFANVQRGRERPGWTERDGAAQFWEMLLPIEMAARPDDRRRLSSGAFEQILSTKPFDFRRIWVERLAMGNEPSTTRILARRALFDFDASVRQAAVMALVARSPKDYTETLLGGFRYPWTPIARHAAEALITLDRKEVVPQLRALSREPDPYTVARNDADKTWTIREVVRVNHFKNCLLCHPPMALPTALEARKKMTVPVGSVAAKGVPITGPYGGVLDIFARADLTYLRPDFAANLEFTKKRETVDRWPTSMQFDFVVRTRKLSAADSVLWPAALTLDDSPNGKSLAFAIQGLTK